MSVYPDFLNDDVTPACRGTDTTLFFPEQGQDPTEAKAICRSCPLRIRCRTWALDQPVGDLHGVWGGLSQHERIDLKRGPVRRRHWRGGPSQHHEVIAKMRDAGATWAEIASATGHHVEGLKAYWKRQRRNQELLREQVAA